MPILIKLMDYQEQYLEERRVCAGCWAELGPTDDFCPLCARPASEQRAIRQPRPESALETGKTSPAIIGAEESRLRGQVSMAALALALLLTGTVIWLEFRVNGFHNSRTELSRPGAELGSQVAPGPQGAPALADFVGQWRVIEGPGVSNNAHFEFVMVNGELVLPLEENGTRSVFRLEDGRLRGAVTIDGMRIDVLAIRADDPREMAVWLYPSKGFAVKLRVIRR